MWGTDYAPVRWADIYGAWEKNGETNDGRMPLTVRKIRLAEGLQDGVQYDWVEKEKWNTVKQCLKKTPEKWLYRRPAPAKGIRKTARMLVETGQPQERAAVWICAVTNDLQGRCVNLWSELDFWLLFQIFCQAQEFLKERNLQWHPAMSKRLPELPFTDDYLENKKKITLQGIVELCSHAAVLTAENYQILSYFSKDVHL